MKLKHLVVDTGAFVKQVNVWDLAENLYTTQGVLDEVRDRVTRRFISDRIGSMLTIMEPNPKSCKAVMEFSKKTGDYPSLSAVDLKLAALTYQIDVEEHGSDSHIKPAPESSVKKQIITYHGGQKMKNNKTEIDMEGFIMPQKKKKVPEKQQELPPEDGFLPLHLALDKMEAHLAGQSFLHSSTLTIEDNNFLTSLLGRYPEIRSLTLYIKAKGKFAAFKTIVEGLNQTQENENYLHQHFRNRPHFLRWVSHIISYEDDEWDWSQSNFTIHASLKQKFMQNDGDAWVSDSPQNGDMQHEESSSGVESYDSEEDFTSDDDEDETNSESSDSDSDGWIGPSNIDKWKASLNLTVEEEKEIKTGCITVDFAIQNTLMHMGLHALGVDGRIIKELKSFILRCYGCFKTTREMERVFCKFCGNKTLKKVSVSTEEDGVERIHININKNIRDSRANIPIPMPKGGKHEFMPILVADQRIPKNMMTKKERLQTDVMAPGYASDKPFVTRDVYSRAATLGLRVKKKKK